MADRIRTGPVLFRETPELEAAIHRWIVRLMLAVTVFLVWREFEPVLTFRSTEGVVLGSAVEKVRVARRRMRGSRFHYFGAVTYRYQVGGERLLGMQERRTNIFGMRADAVEVVRSHPSGSVVRVWYNPLNPRDAVLSRDLDPILFVLIAVAWLLEWRLTVRMARLRETHPLRQAA